MLQYICPYFGIGRFRFRYRHLYLAAIQHKGDFIIRLILGSYPSLDCIRLTVPNRESEINAFQYPPVFLLFRINLYPFDKLTVQFPLFLGSQFFVEFPKFFRIFFIPSIELTPCLASLHFFFIFLSDNSRDSILS